MAPRVTGRPHAVLWAGCDMVGDALHWGPHQGVVRLDVDPCFGLPLAGAEKAGKAPAAAAAQNGGKPAAGGALTGAGLLPTGVPAGVAADVWYAGEGRFPGEPMFVPRPGCGREGSGWLIVALHNARAQRGEVVILDAERPSRGPLATLRLPHRLPSGLHGNWDGSFTGPEASGGAEGLPRFREVGAIRAL